MATIKLCDKCGAEIKANQEIFQLTLERVRTFKFEPTCTRYDMCESCARRLGRWMLIKEEQDGH